MTVKLPGILKKIPWTRVEKKTWLRCLAAVAGGVVFLFCQPVLLPLLEAFMGQAALFSTAVTLPESTLGALRDRFAGDTVEDEPPAGSQPQSTSPASSSQSAKTPPASSQSPPASASSQPLTGDTVTLPAPPEGPAPEIPKKYQGPLVTLNMGGEEGNPAFLHYNNVWLRNYTKLSVDKIQAVLEEECSLELTADEQPQVLIYHTHTTESYEVWDNTVYDTRNSWRDTDNTKNMALVGDLLTQELRKQGIQVIHDTAQHDHPSYNGAYDRSLKTIEDYMEEYPSIKVTIDLHRDGIVQNDNTVLKPVAEIGGKKAAQLMLVAPCDDGSVGVPNWRENLRFAAELQSSIEDAAPGLCRPIFFCYRNYNLGVTDSSLLFELGTNGNTLEEALYTARLIAQPIADVLKGHIQ